MHDSGLKERILVELRHQWVAPIGGLQQRFATHGKAMSQLFEKLRSTPALAILDAQIYPAWTDLVAADTRAPADAAKPYARRTRLPVGTDFRCCFYFCQELMQLMESVYHDLDLERTWQHPDNRGWMNMFRHWSWAPMFRIAWAASAPTYGARFVAFCEIRLDLPRINDAVKVDELRPDAGQGWREQIDALADSGVINHVERGILLSDPLGVLNNPDATPRLFVLRLKWKQVLSRSAEHIHDSTLGVAVVDSSSLRTLRIQDHLRKLGLGAEFMRLLLAQVHLQRVELRSGHYGAVGVVTAREAAALQQEIEALWQQALKHRRAEG